jgi:murein DD-endopeptidase MepM/ murein hydrolase activator NlpD
LWFLLAYPGPLVRLFSRRTLRALPLVLPLVLAVAATGSVAEAQTGNGGQQQQLQNQIAQLDQAGLVALGSLQHVQAQKASLDLRVADLTHQFDAAQARYAPLADEAVRLDSLVAALLATIANTQVKFDDARHAFNVSAAGLYRSARTGAQYLSVLASQPDSLVAENKYLARVSQQRRDLVNEVASLRRDLEQQRKEMVAEQAKADATANDARVERDRIATLRSELEPAQAQAAAQTAAEQAALTQIQGTKTQDQAELASLQGAADGLSAELRARGSGGTPAGACQVRPVPGGVNQPYGGPGGHPGIDLHASYGDPIHACRAGTIVSAGWMGGYGNATVIDHGGGMATLYGHQSRIVVSAGQHVNAGDVIGYIGSTGFSTGPHLHFEVRINGNTVDPAPYL